MITVVYFLGVVLLAANSSRFIFGGDSAEFSAIAHTWSIPHPPGYPLYSLLANTITRAFPFGTIPWRVSLLSVIPTVLTAYLLFKILSHLKIRVMISLLVSLLYIVLFPVWEYALVPEVFALNSFLVTIVTYFLLLYQDSKKTKYLFLSAFFTGLSVAHHHIFLIFVPGWMVLLKDHMKKIVKVRRRFLLLWGSFFLGVSFYLYAPIASYFSPPIQWEDSKTLLGFWRLITRAAYGTFTAYGGSKGNILNQLYDVLSMFILVLQDFRVIGVLCIIMGVGVVIKERKKVFFQFLTLTSFLYIFFLFYTNFTLSNSFSIGMYERFLIAFYILLSIYLAIGYDAFYSTVIKFVKRFSNKNSIFTITKIGLTFILIIYIGTVAKTNFSALSYIKDGNDFDRLGKDIVNTIPPGGIFFVGNDNAHFATLYQVFEEKQQTKAHFFQINFMRQKYYIDQYKKNNKEIIFPNSMQNSGDLEKFIRINKKRGVYLETPTQQGMWMPYGLLWKYYETKEEGIADLANIVAANRRLWTQVYHIPQLNKKTRNILHLQTIQDFYVDAYITYSQLLYLAKNNRESQEVIKKIIEKYRPSNIHAKVTLLNLLVVEKKCKEANTLGSEFLVDSFDLLPPEFVTSIIQYYSTCDPSNRRLQELNKRDNQNKEKSLTPLESF